jgi:hypothetical protein
MPHPDDHIVACETDSGALGATLSCPASASYCPVMTAVVDGCSGPHSAARSAP